jgi:glucose-1-phosphate cytidylyltransferase
LKYEHELVVLSTSARPELCSQSLRQPWRTAIGGGNHVDAGEGTEDDAMKVLLLCGGQGTRLREETEFRPKPLVDIGGRPILWHIMKLYAHFGMREFVLCLGYRGQMIKEYFLDYEAMNNDFTISLGAKNAITYHDNHEEQDFQVTLADTGQSTGTGGRIKRASRFVNEPVFMATYGDGLCDVDLRELLAFHKSHGRLATVTVVRPTSRFGILDISSEGRVTSFAEKPLVDGWASVGYFIFDRAIFDYLDGDDCMLEREPLERLASEGQLVAYKHDGFFFAMDTYREYIALNEMWSKGAAPWRVWGSR